MSSVTRLILGTTMFLALLFGFVDPLWPDAAVSFKRLHIFLFNLVAGGSIILYFTEGRTKVSLKTSAYFVLALLYSLSASAGVYWLTLLISIPLFLVVESVRVRRFSLFPVDFFRPRVSASDKFHQASVLCLSAGIAIAFLVICNAVYFPLVSYEKLTLNVFFLGYSFPISLITMSIMFSFMRGEKGPFRRFLEELAFWLVNLGVIVFFIFIIVEMFAFEITAAVTLFLTVGMIFVLFIRTGARVQQKTFLTSGMTFLLLTGLTGVLYIWLYFLPGSESARAFLLVLHAMVSLYGWNLSGLITIIRWDDFPIKLNSTLVISLHWAIVLVLAPLGKYYPWLALIALPAYIFLLALVCTSRGKGQQRQI
ncbi:MAG: hypothetical protein JXA30_05540 [Deltaproteobacteria bacterium]|nr:hypothetical protein [Deltaproteobacteria bacterium]